MQIRIWKLAKVIPIPKSGDSEKPSTTRLISLLSIISKIYEREPFFQFVDFLHGGK